MLLALAALVFGIGVPAAAAVSVPAVTRVKDIARLQGVRANQLNGMGLVVGLNGTGDSSKANAEIVANALAKWGVQVNASDLKVKNIAVVAVTAKFPPYLHQGDTIDVQVSSVGDAKSLQGGVLLQTPLVGADGKVYAVAQGPVYVGGYSFTGRNASQQKNITTVGIISNGAIVEREVPMQLDHNGRLRWALNTPDFTTAVRLAETINDNIAIGAARALDMGLVEVLIPRERMADPISYIAEIENLPVTPDGIAKVVVNERNGTIVVGDKVRIATVAVTHRNITVKVGSETAVSQPAPFSMGQTVVTSGDRLDVQEEEGNMILMPAGTDIGGIVRALNAVGTTPQDIIAILVAIKEAGALYGVLEFI
ncbi:MAG: flagellar basal body P-ring protein FlgI [Firmicutes bacterium]|nr:flagellar basal body P-ring protein FlgI [Bacillota bacterium]